MAAAIAITTGFSQETPPPAAVPATMSAAATLPVQRTLTDTAGRKMEATLTEKTATTIKGKTVSGKEFDIPLAKLSPEDQSFIEGLQIAPVAPPKKLRILLVSPDTETEAALSKAGYETTVIPRKQVMEDYRGNPSTVPSYFPEIEKFSDDDVRQYDALWVNGNYSQTNKDRLLTLIPVCRTVIWQLSTKITRAELLGEKPSKGKGRPANKTEPYVAVDGNITFYNNKTQEWNPKDGSRPITSNHPEILDEIIKKLAE